MSSLVFVLLATALSACVHDLSVTKAPLATPSTPKARVAGELGSKFRNKTKMPVAVAPEPPAAPVENQVPPVCEPLSQGMNLPQQVIGLPIVLMNFVRSCQMEDGREGYLKGSPWTAMGFPCTAGHGRIDKKGSDNVPSLISFHLQNSCPMQPSRTEEVEQLVRQKIALPKDSHLIAYYPFSVEYWEFVDLAERDTGFRPELYVPASISNGWQKFSTKAEALKIRLYGRENAWQPGKRLYEATAQILPEGRSSFRLQVQSVRVLDEKARAEVRDRCEKIRPQRPCEEIFAGLE